MTSFRKQRNNNGVTSPSSEHEAGQQRREGMGGASKNVNRGRKYSNGSDGALKLAEEGKSDGSGRKPFRLSPVSPKAPRKVNTRVSIRGMLRKSKSSKNGFPGMLNHSLEVEPLPPSYQASVDSRGLSASTDRTYNAMLQSKVISCRMHGKTSIQARIYNFLERPTGWKCFIYHFTV